MAPRARGRKDTRMDAAIDGFDEKLVRSTVNDLLKVYKGKNRTLNPWRFIEEGCYTLLNEQLLEKVQAQAQDAVGNRDADPLEDAALLEDAAPLDDAALRPQALPFYVVAIMLHKMMDQRLEPQGLPFYVLAQRLSTTHC